MPDQNSPNPGRIMQNMNAFHCSAALKGAIDLGLFTALGGDAMTAAALGRAIDAPERSVRILCDFLTIQGLLEKDGAAYRSSPDSALFLDENSPAYFGTVGRFMMGPNVADNFSNVAAVVRKGGTLLEGQGTVEPENPIWVDFARSMVPLMKPSADFIADLVTKDIGADVPLRVLDIAAGHGIFGIEIAVRHPGARIVALDWPAVLEVASENAEKAGVTDRLTMLPGSAFDMDYGDGFDLVLLTNFPASLRRDDVHQPDAQGTRRVERRGPSDHARVRPERGPGDASRPGVVCFYHAGHYRGRRRLHLQATGKHGGRSGLCRQRTASDGRPTAIGDRQHEIASPTNT